MAFTRTAPFDSSITTDANLFTKVLNAHTDTHELEDPARSVQQNPTRTRRQQASDVGTRSCCTQKVAHARTQQHRSCPPYTPSAVPTPRISKCAVTTSRIELLYVAPPGAIDRTAPPTGCCRLNRTSLSSGKPVMSRAPRQGKSACCCRCCLPAGTACKASSTPVISRSHHAHSAPL